MTTQTITKSVHLSENWEANDHALFKQYMSEVYAANQSINEIFDDKNLRVISMDLEIKVHVEEVTSELPDPEANEIGEEMSASTFAETIATSLLVDAIDNPVSSTNSVETSSDSSSD